MGYSFKGFPPFFVYFSVLFCFAFLFFFSLKTKNKKVPLSLEEKGWRYIPASIQGIIDELLTSDGVVIPSSLITIQKTIQKIRILSSKLRKDEKLREVFVF